METSHLPAYDYRPGEGPTLVFLHYWGGAARTWQPVIERLPGRGTLAVEARGWGRSRSLPGPYTLRQLAQDTHDIVTDAGLGEYVLVGHSMGGRWPSSSPPRIRPGSPGSCSSRPARRGPRPPSPPSTGKLWPRPAKPTKPRPPPATPSSPPPRSPRNSRPRSWPTRLDRVEPPEVLRDNLVPYLGNAGFRVIPRSGHLVPSEAPAELAGILRAVG
jgi:hypothetical protein